MKKLSLNQDWLFASGTITMMELFTGSDGKIQTVDLPHDAMIYQERRQDTANMHQTGFYPGGEYTYIKQWKVPEELEGKTVILEFEGVADTCRIYFNGVLKAVSSNPYRGIYVDVSDDLNCGTVNEIKVEVRSVEQSSRWYSGAGLYRPVLAWIGEEIYIPIDGVRITTQEVTGILPGTAGRTPAAVEDRYAMADETDVADRDMTAVVEVSVSICNRARARKSTQLQVVLCEMEVPSRQNAEDILARAEQVSSSGDASRVGCVSDSREVTTECLPVTIPGESTVQQVIRLTVDQPRLWSDETPNLYTCQVDIMEAAGTDVKGSPAQIIDSVSVPFGIRVLGLSAKQGLMINGKPVKLRGSCIHHDNGILGAATFADAEYRRCRQLKEAGFNALRSAHHPMSKAMLDACDRLGMLVMDELSDMWTRTKNPHDYANHFSLNWEQDVENMIAKDYNHPGVILYSTGNEIPEAGTAYGADWNRRINAKMKQLDPTRYTTSGINGLMAASDRMGEIMCQATGMSPEQLAAMMSPEQAGENADMEQGGMEAAGASSEAPARTSAAEENRSAIGGSAGADAVNGMAAVMVGPLADAIATCPLMEEIIGEFAGVNDIAGYNYLTALHEEEHRRHPNRVVLGTETFPADIVHLWDVVRRNPHVLAMSLT